MSLFTQNVQMLMARETTPGNQVATLFSSGNAAREVINPSLTPDVEKITRDVAVPDFTKRRPSPGIRTGSLTFQMEIAGPADGNQATEPPFGLPMQACGFVQRRLRKVGVKGFTDGEICKTGQTFLVLGSIVGTVVGTVSKVLSGSANPVDDLDDDTLYYYLALPASVDTGIADDSALVMAAQAYDATITASGAAADAGYGYIAVSRPTTTMTIVSPGGASMNFPKGSIIRGITSNAVGVVEETVDMAVAASYTLKFREIHKIFGELNGSPIGGGEDITRVGSPALTTDPALVNTATVIQDAYPTLTMAINEDGVAKVLKGCRGEFTYEFPSGRPALANFTFQGIYTIPLDTPLFDGVAAAGAKAPKVQGVQIRLDDSFAAGGVDAIGNTKVGEVNDEWIPCPSSFSWQVSNSLNRRECFTDPTGATNFFGGDREMAGTMDPEAVIEEVFNGEFKALELTPFRFRMSYGTKGSGNSFRLVADDASFDSFQSGDRNGIRTHDISLRFYGVASGDEMVMITD